MHSGVALIDPHPIFEKINLSSGMRVADFGCGRTGHFVFPASRVVGESGIVYAIDIIKDILVSIESRIKSEGFFNVHTVWGDIERVGKVVIPEKSLDACFFVNVLHLLKEKQNSLKEAMRLLKNNGFLVLIDWKKRIGPLGPSDADMVNKEEVINMLKELGLDFNGELDNNEYHYTIIGRK